MADRKTDWKQGDVVKLASGGPMMTVVAKDNRNSATLGQFICQWFDEGGKLCNGHFEAACLREA